MDASSQYLLEIGERVGNDYLRNALAIFFSVVVGVKFATAVVAAIRTEASLRATRLVFWRSRSGNSESRHLIGWDANSNKSEMAK